MNVVELAAATAVHQSPDQQLVFVRRSESKDTADPTAPIAAADSLQKAAHSRWRINDIFSRLSVMKLAVYTPIRYILPSRLQKYEEIYDTEVEGNRGTLRQADRELSLRSLMTTNLLKRLESSVAAFRLTLRALDGNINRALGAIADYERTGRVASVTDHLGDGSTFDPDDDEFDGIDEFNVGRKVQISLADMDVPSWKQIYRYLVKNDYTDDADNIAEAYHAAQTAGTLAALPDELKPFADQVFQLIDSVFSAAQMPKIDDGRKPKTNPLNANFEKKEFQELWSRINRKAVYRVEFDSSELIEKCIRALNSHLRVTPLQYTVQTGEQNAGLTDSQLRAGDGFTVTNTTTERGASVHSRVRYDLVGKVAENTQLTRETTASVLKQIESAVFAQFKQNPEHFISEASRLISEQKASMVIERLAYGDAGEGFTVDIFTAGQTGQDFSRATAQLKKHVYDYAITDSDVERQFVKELDTSSEVVVYAKLPRGFLIPTPVGDYNPDWAISFQAGQVKHIYFVAETKGSMSSLKLREIEKTKIECARKFFNEINLRITQDRVRYDVVTDYAKLMDIVGHAP